MFNFRAMVRVLVQQEVDFAIVGGLAFEDVVDHLDWMELDGTPVRVLSLPRLIEVKRKLTRPKDQLVWLQLQATLEEREKCVP